MPGTFPIDGKCPWAVFSVKGVIRWASRGRCRTHAVTARPRGCCAGLRRGSGHPAPLPAFGAAPAGGLCPHLASASPSATCGVGPCRRCFWSGYFHLKGDGDAAGASKWRFMVLPSCPLPLPHARPAQTRRPQARRSRHRRKSKNRDAIVCVAGTVRFRGGGGEGTPQPRSGGMRQPRGCGRGSRPGPVRRARRGGGGWRQGRWPHGRPQSVRSEALALRTPQKATRRPRRRRRLRQPHGAGRPGARVIAARHRPGRPGAGRTRVCQVTLLHASGFLQRPPEQRDCREQCEGRPPSVPAGVCGWPPCARRGSLNQALCAERQRLGCSNPPQEARLKVNSLPSED